MWYIVYKSTHPLTSISLSDLWGSNFLLFSSWYLKKKYERKETAFIPDVLTRIERETIEIIEQRYQMHVTWYMQY